MKSSLASMNIIGEFLPNFFRGSLGNDVKKNYSVVIDIRSLS